MKLSYTAYQLNCIHPFGLSRGTATSFDRVFIYLSHEGITGRGEAAPSFRYNENTRQIIGILSGVDSFPDISESLEGIEQIIKNVSKGVKSLEAGLSQACLDWYGKYHKRSVANILGGNVNLPQTSYTIAIGDLKTIPEKIKESSDYPILKVKLGTAHDKEIIEIIRGLTDKPVRVDANEGWDLDTAIEMSNWLQDRGVEFIEQPLPAKDLEAFSVLKGESPLKIFADENVIDSESISRIAHAFHGINIKLSKCGSLFEARRMIETGRTCGLDIMLGCMIESSLGITAAAHLASMVDYADLDGNVLISNDPYTGVQVRKGRLILDPGKPGLGVRKNEKITIQNPEIL